MSKNDIANVLAILDAIDHIQTYTEGVNDADAFYQNRVGWIEPTVSMRPRDYRDIHHPYGNASKKSHEASGRSVIDAPFLPPGKGAVPTVTGPT